MLGSRVPRRLRFGPWSTRMVRRAPALIGRREYTGFVVPATVDRASRAARRALVDVVREALGGRQRGSDHVVHLSSDEARGRLDIDGLRRLDQRVIRDGQ